MRNQTKEKKPFFQKQVDYHTIQLDYAQNLPRDSWKNIFFNLDSNTLKQLQLVNKHFNVILKDNAFWKQVAIKEFPYATEWLQAKSQKTNFKALFFNTTNYQALTHDREIIHNEISANSYYRRAGLKSYACHPCEPIMGDDSVSETCRRFVCYQGGCTLAGGCVGCIIGTEFSCLDSILLGVPFNWLHSLFITGVGAGAGLACGLTTAFGAAFYCCIGKSVKDGYQNIATAIHNAKVKQDPDYIAYKKKQDRLSVINSNITLFNRQGKPLIPAATELEQPQPMFMQS